jgi:hypothetical protein
VALAGYLIAVTGFPVPAAAAKRAGIPFPCQNNPCGCQTAEQCWSGCTCLTPEQRWAWAREHNVEPPPYAERPAARGCATVRLRDPVEGWAADNAPDQSSCCRGERPATGTPPGDFTQATSTGVSVAAADVAVKLFQCPSDPAAAASPASPTAATATSARDHEGFSGDDSPSHRWR